MRRNARQAAADEATPAERSVAYLRRSRRRERIGDRTGKRLMWEGESVQSGPYGTLRKTPTMRPSTTTSSA